MISFTSVGGNDIYSINCVECRDSNGTLISKHYEIRDLFRRKSIAIFDSLDEAQEKFDSIFKTMDESIPLRSRY